MKRILLATALVALSAGAALADNLAGFYGNTVAVTLPDGKVSKTKVQADHTYTTTNPDGSKSSGTWAWSTEPEACFTQVAPAPAAGTKPFCVKVDAHKVGDKWETKSADGKSVTKYELTAG